VSSFEFQYLGELISQTEFDTIYHEHFSYLSLTAAEAVLEAAGLTVFEVERLTTHGGSLRVYAQVAGGRGLPVARSVDLLRAEEAELGLRTSFFYSGFQPRVNLIRDQLRSFLIDARKEGRTVVGYGAAAKGNTLLNYAGVGPDLVRYVVDNNPAKQGHYLPGSHIPIVEEHRLAEDQPDFVLILPWNLRDEIRHRLESLGGWSGSMVTAIPKLIID